MLKSTDNILHRKGTTYLIADANGDLVKIQPNGDRITYPKTGGGSGSYLAGYGLKLSNQTFSIDSDIVAKKTDVPTVNDSTITFIQGGVTKGSFTLNQASSSSISLDLNTYSAGSGITLNNNIFGIDYSDTNTANKLVKLNASGKIPENLYEKGSGGGGDYLPLSGGVIDGELEVNDDVLFKLNLEVEQGLSAQTLDVTSDATISGVSFINLYNTVGTANNILENI